MSGTGQLGTAAPVRVGATAARQRSDPNAVTAGAPSEFLDLQRRVGNRATHALITSLAPPTAPGTLAPRGGLHLPAGAGHGPHTDEFNDALHLQSLVGNRAVARALRALNTGVQDLRVAPAEAVAEAQAEAVSRGVETTISPSAGGGALAPAATRALLQQSGHAAQPLP